MKLALCILAWLTLEHANAEAQESEIVGFNVTSLTYTVSSPPANSELHFCLDLVQWDWHSFPVDSWQKCTTVTNAYDLWAIDWEAFPNSGERMFLRVVCNSNDIATTVTTNCLTFTNASASTVSNITIGVRNWVGDLGQVTNLAELAVGASTVPVVFVLQDPHGAMSLGGGRFDGTYMQAGSLKPIDFAWFWWGPTLANRVVRFGDSAFTIE
jgi:hypothetical protein